MKRILFVGLLLLALPVAAETRSCDYQRRDDGGFSLTCAANATTPVPVPVDPRQPGPTPSQPPPGVVMQTLASNNASAIHEGSAGVIYSFALPRCELSQCQFELGSTPGTPTEMDAEVGFSRVPGDLGYWRMAPVISGRGAQVFPCGIVAGASQGFAARWGTSGSFDVCPVNPLEQWFVSVRYGPACGASCRVAYKVNFKP